MRARGKGNISSCLGVSASWICLLSEAGLSLPVTQVPQKRELALCPPAGLLPCCSRNSLIVAVTFEGYKQDMERKSPLLEDLGLF